MLTKLPNGDWINPQIVVEVNTLLDKEYGPRVTIITKQGGHRTIEFDDPEAARRWAQEFAHNCNAADPCHAAIDALSDLARSGVAKA